MKNRSSKAEPIDTGGLMCLRRREKHSDFKMEVVREHLLVPFVSTSSRKVLKRAAWLEHAIGAIACLAL